MGTIRRTGRASERSGLIAVLDTAAVGALAPANETARARLRSLRRRSSDLLIPAAVLAEGLLTGHPGRDHHVRGLLNTLSVIVIDEALALDAGRLRQQAIADGADPAPSGVDAMVAAVADARAAVDDVQIITSDPDDIEALVLFGHHIERITIIAV